MRTSRLVLRIPVPGRGIKPIRCSVRSIRQDLAAFVDAHIASAAELTLEEVLLVENTVTCRREADQHLSAERPMQRTASVWSASPEGAMDIGTQ